MGTLLTVRLEAVERTCGLAASEAVLAEVARLEGVLSSWRGDSEVGRLNRAEPGEPQPLSAELYALLAEARRLVAETSGAFDPGVGALLAAWDLQGAGRVPDQEELAAARAASGLALLRGDDAAGTVTRPSAGWRLDTGAFGKGAALRAAAAVLKAHGVGSAVLDFGGQLLVLGAPRRVAVADPVTRALPTPLTLQVGGESVATTSAGERFVTVAGRRYGHVLDPRTGWPVPAWGSVTVVAPDPLAADALATALFVLGPDAARGWAAAHPEHRVVVQELAAGDVALTEVKE
jgi:thiamine biosynthesis lipoprotein